MILLNFSHPMTPDHPAEVLRLDISDILLYAYL
jgi:hypothetical protein